MPRVWYRLSNGGPLLVRFLLWSARGLLRPRRRQGRRHPRVDHGRAQFHLALRRAAARPGCQARRPRRGLDAAAARLAPRRGARRRGTLAEGRHAQPDWLLQGPGRLGGAVERASPRLHDRGVRLNGKPGDVGGGARGLHRLAQRHAHPVGPREVQDRHDGDLWRHRARRRRQLRRREPAVRRARG